MAIYRVTAERLKSMSTPSRDEERTPLPETHWFNNLKAAFEWADSGNLLGEMFGWQHRVWLMTTKASRGYIEITKVTEQMIYEDELYKALEGLKASYYSPKVLPQKKAKLNSVYGKIVADTAGPWDVVVYDIDHTELFRDTYEKYDWAIEFCKTVNKLSLGTAFVVKTGEEK